MRIVVRTPIIAERLTAVAHRHGVESTVAADMEALRAALGDADALWLWPAFYDAPLVDALARNMPRLRWLQVLTMGFDPLVAHGVPAGLAVTNAGDSYAPTVAEHAVATLLALVRRLPEMMASAAQSQWDQSVAARIGTLNDATVAVLGFGNIGKEIAKRLRACGARVVAVTRSGRADPLADESATVDRLEDVLARADAVIAAVPLDGSTRGIIGTRALAALRPHALVVNIARGGGRRHGRAARRPRRGAHRRRRDRRDRSRAAAGRRSAVDAAQRDCHAARRRLRRRRRPRAASLALLDRNLRTLPRRSSRSKRR